MGQLVNFYLPTIFCLATTLFLTANETFYLQNHSCYLRSLKYLGDFLHEEGFIREFFIGGLDSSTLGEQPSIASTSSSNDTVVETDEIFEDNIQVSQASKPSEQQSDPNDRRAKIAKFLKDEREKRMTPKVSFESQQLKYLKDDIEIKRKLAEKDDEAEKELLIEAKRMRSTMEDMSKAMTNCFQMMTNILQGQMKPQVYHQPEPQVYHQPYSAGVGMHAHVFHGNQRKVSESIPHINNTREELPNEEHESLLSFINRK